MKIPRFRAKKNNELYSVQLADFEPFREKRMSIERLSNREFGKSPENFSGEEVKKMGRREFVRFAGLTSMLAAAGIALSNVGVAHAPSAPTAGWNVDSGSMVEPLAYIIFSDSGPTYLARNGLNGSMDFSSSVPDFGLVHNQCIGALPTGSVPNYLSQGGRLFIKKSSATYKYSTTPLINASYVQLWGEGRSTVLEPASTVDGVTIQSPPGSGLLAPEIRNLTFFDPLGKGVGKSYIVIDSGTNIQNIVHGIIDNIYWWGGPNQASSTGKLIQQKGVGSGAFNLNGTVADFTISNIMAGSNFLSYAGSAPFLPLSTSDSLFDFVEMYDCTFRDWFVGITNYYGTNPAVFSGHATKNVSTGSQYYNIKGVISATLNNVALFNLNNMGDSYIEDLFVETGAGIPVGTIGLELGGFATRELRIRRVRIQGNDLNLIGIQFDATCQHEPAAGGFGNADVVVEDMAISNVGTVLKSIAGDASNKFFHGGLMAGTTLMSPNPLTGAVFAHVSRGPVTNGLNPEWGWAVVTPGLPAGIGIGNAVRNTTGVPITVYQTGESGTHIIDNSGTDIAIGFDPQTIRLSPNAQIYYAVAIPTGWKWFGVM